jgi:hypothetical protein
MFYKIIFVCRGYVWEVVSVEWMMGKIGGEGMNKGGGVDWWGFRGMRIMRDFV